MPTSTMCQVLIDKDAYGYSLLMGTAVWVPLIEFPEMIDSLAWCQDSQPKFWGPSVGRASPIPVGLSERQVLLWSIRVSLVDMSVNTVL